MDICATKQEYAKPFMLLIFGECVSGKRVCVVGGGKSFITKHLFDNNYTTYFTLLIGM